MNKRYASRRRAACFTSWYPGHNNPRYIELFPRLTSIVQSYDMTFSRHRLIRALQYSLWRILKRKFIYPVVLWFLSQRHEVLFTADVQQIPSWPKNKNVVVDVDDPLFSSTEIRLLKLPQVKAVIVTTEKAKVRFRESGVKRPIHIMPQGVSLERIEPSKIMQIRVRFKEEDDVVVGYHAPTLTLSCDGPRRARGGMDDLDFLFGAVEEARKMEFRMKIWLLGESSKSVKKYVADGRGSWIRLFGYVPHFDVLNYISNFDIAVYPRVQPDFIRFRVKIAQYMACGVPIISTDAEEGPVIIIKEANCGLVCDSQENFVEALVTLARSRDMRLELGKAGQRYAVENLDWSILVQRYKQIINQV